MLIEFKYGFEYKGFLFGWYRKELYRLPSISTNYRNYGIKKLKLIDVGSVKGYRVKRAKLTVSQCVEMTTVIDKAIHICNQKNVPLIPSM